MKANIQTAEKMNNTYATPITRPDYIKIVTSSHNGRITPATIMAIEARNIRELGAMIHGEDYIPRPYLRVI